MKPRKATIPELLNATARDVSPLWRKLAICLACGLIVGFVSAAVANHAYRSSLTKRIAAIASVLDFDAVAAIAHTGLPDDDKAVAGPYDDIRGKMAAVKSSDPSLRFAYVMGRDSGRVHFLADSEPADSPDHSPRGEPYPEASPELLRIFDDGESLVEGPVRDRWGTWLSALAPVKHADDGRPVAVIGIDVPASSYLFLMSVAAGIPLILAGMVAVVVAAIHASQRRQQEALRLRAEFVSVASHELRSPLTGLRWSEESLLREPLNDKQMHMVRIMHNITVRLEESIESVLHMSNLEAGRRPELMLKQENIISIFEEVYTMYQLSAERRSIKLEYADSWPPSLIVQCDGRRMRRVIGNLVGNAVKYSRQGGSVTAAYAHTAEGHQFSVTDHGIGIPDDEIGKVFDGFFRASNTASHDVSGTGMGLLMSRTIVEQHGGRIWLESKQDQGTTAFLLLPDNRLDEDSSAEPKSSSATDVPA